MKMLRFIMIAAMCLAVASPAIAVQPDEVLADATLEARARDLSAKLRCLVCQNQSIDDSDAPLARDLRVLLRKRLTEGDSDDQVIDYLVGRYGEFILLKPRLSTQTLILWAGPFAILLFGIWKIAGRRRQASPSTVEQPLTDGESKRLEALLHGNKDA